MAHAEPRKGARRLAIGVGVIALGAIAAVMLVRNADRPITPEAPLNDARASAPPVAPRSEPQTAGLVPTPAVLDRSALLAAARSAAAAYAEDEETPTDVAALVGRRFLVRIPFGCAGPATAETGEAAFWSLGADGGTLQVSVRPEIWTDSPFARAIGGEELEAVEGFWIPRPWQTSETCPARSDDPLLAEAPASSPQTVGLASVFGAESSRLGRRGERPYELTLQLSEFARPGGQGLQFVLEGRIAALSGGGPVACRAAGPEQRPVCLLGVQIERVAIRNPETDRVLGEWRDAAPLTPGLPAGPASPAATTAAARPS